MVKQLMENTFLIEGLDEEKIKELQKQSERNIGWETVYAAYQNNKILQAEVTAIETIGKIICAIVNVEGVKGLIPLELFGVQSKRQMREYMGRKVMFTVENYDREHEVFTGSRIEAQRRRAAMTIKQLKEGMETYFVVTAVRRHGLYGDIGGITSFIPIQEVRHGWIDDLYEEYKVGDLLKVKVLEISEKSTVAEEEKEEVQEQNKENRKLGEEEEKPIEYRVKVSAKILHSSPWEENGKAYEFKKGSEYVGTVSGIAEYGVFIRLADGVDSLARHMKFENVNKGDKVRVRVRDIDVEKEQITTKILGKIT